MKVLKVLGQELKLKLSPSFLNNAACPAYLKFHYVDKVGEQFIRIAAERGSAAHGAIAELLEYAMKERMEVQDIPNGMLREALQKHLPHKIIADVALVYGWIELWRDRFKIPNNIHGIEDKIALDDEYDECAWDNAAYRGILDLNQISGTHCTITDWKSQPHIMGQGELDEHEQLTMYCWLAWKLYPHLKSFTARIWYLRYGFYGETTRTVEQLEAFENALMIKEKKVLEIDSWDPIPGKHCQYCDYIHRCPLAQDLSPNNPEVITQEQAVLAAQRVTVMDALSKELKSKLKLYVDNNDDVMIGDKWVYGYRHSQSVKWDAEETEEVLREHGHSLSEVASVDAKRMKKFLKEQARENPPLEVMLNDIKKEKHATQFKGHQRGSEPDDEE